MRKIEDEEHGYESIFKHKGTGEELVLIQKGVEKTAETQTISTD